MAKLISCNEFSTTDSIIELFKANTFTLYVTILFYNLINSEYRFLLYSIFYWLLNRSLWENLSWSRIYTKSNRLDILIPLKGLFSIIFRLIKLGYFSYHITKFLSENFIATGKKQINSKTFLGHVFWK